MSELELRPRVFVAGLIQPGDIVLTTTPEWLSQRIRKVTGSDISHAMICVGKSSVIDSTGDGVHARNLERLILEPGCAGHVLRPVNSLTTDQLRSVISFVRAAVGTRYTMTGAAKSVLAGFVAGRRQFCSRLVAQAYRNAGVNLVSDADFCHPGELLNSATLVEVPHVLRNLSLDEEADWREDIDNVQAMRDSTNALLREARKLCPEIESLNDIDAYLVEHPEGDAHLVEALRYSRYLELWRDELERNSWQYNVVLMEDGALPVLNASVPGKLKQTPVRVDCYPRIQATVAGGQAGDGLEKNSHKFTDKELAFVDWDALWLTLEQYKRLRGWTHLVIDRASLPMLFHPNHHGWYTLLIPPSQVHSSWENVPLWQRLVLELLKRYVEAFYNHNKKAFFEPRLELQPLTINHANLQVEEYRLTVEASEQQLIQDIEMLAAEIEQNHGGIVPNADGSSVRAAMTGMQLLKPMLHVKNKCPISVTPVPLNESEFNFVRDLHAFIHTAEGMELLDGAELFLLRNKARGGGIGFFEAGAFYPDFILWMLRDGRQHVVFVEPHGLKHEERDGLKIKFHETIKGIEQRVNEGRADRITLDCFIASPTPMAQLQWGDGWNSLDKFGRQHVLMMKDEPDEYVGRMFKSLSGCHA